jgi:hypothetical protein
MILEPKHKNFAGLLLITVKKQFKKDLISGAICLHQGLLNDDITLR